MVEEGQHVVAASVQGAAEVGEFVEGRGSPRRRESISDGYLVLPWRRSGWL